MARLVFSLSTVLFVGLWLPSVAPRQLEEDTMSVRFDQWMANHGVEYESIEEKEKRFNVFKENLRFIESVNAEKRSYKLSLNTFADLSLDEFRKQYLGLRGDATARKKAPVEPFMYANLSAPNTMDWREQGVVTPIKNQQTCGCCWAFSAVAAMESITKMKTGNLVSLSEQQVLDCTGGGSKGCLGGFMDEAFRFIIHNGGLARETDYPYQSIQGGTCDAQKSSSKAATITDYHDVPPADEDSLLLAVANQPVSVGIDGSAFGFKHYSEGVFTGDCGTQLNHAVTIIGYGTEDGVDYWLIKNSWGEAWGDNGYMKLKRGDDLCGIADLASYPVA